MGRYNEFRMYSGFLQVSDIAADYAAGPNVIGTDFILHALASGSSLALSWSPAMSGWVLQSSPALGPGAVWTAVNLTPVFQDNRYRVTVPLSDPAYFRLHQGP